MRARCRAADVATLRERLLLVNVGVARKAIGYVGVAFGFRAKLALNLLVHV